MHQHFLGSKTACSKAQVALLCDVQTIRTSLLDVREKAYERSGLGSSYLFRIDEAWAVDATRQVISPCTPHSQSSTSKLSFMMNSLQP